MDQRAALSALARASAAWALHWLHRMPACECCGNTYDKAFEISIGGTTHTFDSFECAIQTIAPRCAQCKCPIIGHGVEARGQYFCCAHCARRGGVTEVSDRAHDGGQAPP